MVTKLHTSVAFDESGNLISLKVDGKEFVKPEQKSGLFVLQLRDSVGNAIRIRACQFQQRQVTEEDEGWQIRFDRCGVIDSLSVCVEAKCRENGIKWKLAVMGLPEYVVLEWADYPKLPVRRSTSMQILLPYCEGLLIDDVALLEQTTFGRNEYPEFPFPGRLSYYPGTSQMQFLAVSQEACALYVGCEDPAHSVKCLEIAADSDDSFRLILQQYSGGENSFEYEVVTEGVSGNWYDAAERYRDWMTQYDRTLPSPIWKRMPKWLADGPVVLALPIKGQGLDAGSIHPNEYYPYSNISKLARTYQEKLKTPLLALLMHWEGTAPWAPPYIWPPFGGEAQMKDFIEDMHKDGNRVGLYASGIGWTQRSMIEPAYSREKQFQAEHLELEMCRGPHQELNTAVCNGVQAQRLGYDLCSSRNFTRKTVCGEIAQAAAAGVDYLQYFDQNPGGTAPVCYAWNHDHPSYPGAWMAECMGTLLKAAENAAGKTVLGCEYGAAEPFLETCMLNDLRGHLNWSYGRPVPLFQYLFHEYSWGFSGNAIALNQMLDTAATPGLLVWHLACHFAVGDLMTVVMKDKGQIHWCWVNPWSSSAPEQEPICTLLANLSALRKGTLRDVFLYGRMEKPPRIEGPKRPIVHLDKRVFMLDAVIGSAWTWKGHKAILLVNSLETAAECKVEVGKDIEITVESQHDLYHVSGHEIPVTLQPLSGVLLQF